MDKILEKKSRASPINPESLLQNGGDSITHAFSSLLNVLNVSSKSRDRS
jgi:hypothetical protein